MPLVASATLAYATGLLAGFGAYPWTAVAALLVVRYGARTARERLALAAIAVAGLAIATVGRVTAASCEAKLLTESAWTLTLDGEASPGAFVAARHACGAAFRLSVE